MDIKDVLVNAGIAFRVAYPKGKFWLIGLKVPGAVSENNEGLVCNPCIIFVALP
jgi:hypothetical protein